MKTDLDSIVAKETKSDETKRATCFRTSIMNAQTQERIYGKTCIFYQKENKYLKGTKTRDTLIRCRQLHSDASVRNTVVKKMDERILALVSRDLIAAEGHHHS